MHSKYNVQVKNAVRTSFEDRKDDIVLLWSIQKEAHLFLMTSSTWVTLGKRVKEIQDADCCLFTF